MTWHTCLAQCQTHSHLERYSLLIHLANTTHVLAHSFHPYYIFRLQIGWLILSQCTQGRLLSINPEQVMDSVMLLRLNHLQFMINGLSKCDIPLIHCPSYGEQLNKQNNVIALIRWYMYIGSRYSLMITCELVLKQFLKNKSWSHSLSVECFIIDYCWF